jgi:hypothetical protein
LCEDIYIFVFAQYVGIRMSKYRTFRRKLEVRPVAASKTNTYCYEFAFIYVTVDTDILKTCTLPGLVLRRAFTTSISHGSHVEGCGDVRALEPLTIYLNRAVRERETVNLCSHA